MVLDSKMINRKVIVSYSHSDISVFVDEIGKRFLFRRDLCCTVVESIKFDGMGKNEALIVYLGSSSFAAAAYEVHVLCDDAQRRYR